MRRFVITAVVAALGIGISGSATAGDRGGKGGKSSGGGGSSAMRSQIQSSNSGIKLQSAGSNQIFKKQNGSGMPQMQTLNQNGSRIPQLQKLNQNGSGIPQLQQLGQNGNKKLTKLKDKQDLGIVKNGNQKDQKQKENHKDKDQKHKDFQFKFKKNCHFVDYTGHCYRGFNVQFWSTCYFDSRYGCEIYYCPIRLCWYFWYEPWDCYLPCTYWVNVCEF
jgi:hypothetical protein